MPDDLDYEWLRELLAAPERWTEEDASSVRQMIANQKRAIDDMHPADVAGRRSAQRVVGQLEAALLAYHARRSPPG